MTIFNSYVKLPEGMGVPHFIIQVMDDHFNIETFDDFKGSSIFTNPPGVTWGEFTAMRCYLWGITIQVLGVFGWVSKWGTLW